jgi:hypothetical protein
MHGVKALRLFLSEADKTGGDNLELIRFEDLDDIADVAGFDRVGLDDGERAFDSHVSPLGRLHWRRTNAEL